MSDIDKFYVSPYDEFLYKFDREHEKSKSQVKEIKKHERIAKLRDDPNAQDEKEKIWSEF
ncbi:hypothetical protein E3983_09685 [Legionella israelensis]|uniref:Uncharacterized protein n=1 Tax=Legionella israelensis TaxID=454 RepID=A0A0W0W6F8_9GAMM|nr:CBU_0585 family protein [Legionella israelensis]KTD27526.1 hypothetical protein Lisr_0985 [Legionella israelensis]QBR84612.1 hypothetical protein E3983_09685 [Legionella israelensis]QBS10582.1 hypothetical protein E4T55_12465 [Legionella israelensis]QDP72267.1 hypothetical protein FOG18_06710 [Legionella israelensis]SCY36243.1 hypothetical protein SAMN02746069_02184 [Legionella israelensis DSM 19235]